MAWVGIAAVRYRRENGSTRCDKLIAGIANYLLGLRTTAGLVKGGPDVGWISKQHSLLTDAFLRDLIASLKSKSMSSSLGISSTTLSAAETKMAAAILGTLLVQSGSQAYFVEGVNDANIPHAAVLTLLTTTQNGTTAPAGADQNYTSNDAWGEYHTWPASAAASWVILRVYGGADQLFAH